MFGVFTDGWQDMLGVFWSVSEFTPKGRGSRQVLRRTCLTAGPLFSAFPAQAGIHLYILFRRADSLRTCRSIPAAHGGFIWRCQEHRAPDLCCSKQPFPPLHAVVLQLGGKLVKRLAVRFAAYLIICPG